MKGKIKKLKHLRFYGLLELEFIPLDRRVVECGGSAD